MTSRRVGPSSDCDLLVRGGTVLSAEGSRVADLAVSGGKVVSVGDLRAWRAPASVDARGMMVLPGAVDAHTHFDMPFAGGRTADDFLTGTTAAACGGTTTIVDFATQTRGRSLREALDRWHGKADGRSAVDYGFHMAVVDLPESRLRELDAMVTAGVPSFKFYMAYPGTLMSEDDALLRALFRSRENGGLVCVHAENGRLIEILVRRALAEGRTAPRWHAATRPAAAEAEAARRALTLSGTAGAPLYIVHVSAGETLEEARRARARGQTVLLETCPQYLFLDEKEYSRPGPAAAGAVISPPLRPREDGRALWKGISAGEFQAVATDHCSFRMRSSTGKPGKDRGRKDFSRIPNGAPGVETRLPLLWDAVSRGLLSPRRLVELVSTGPAKALGLHPRKGNLSPGADADIVVLDPRARTRLSWKTLHMAVDYNPYEGRLLRGKVRDVFVRGRAAVLGGVFVGSPSHGRFLRRSPRDG